VSSFFVFHSLRTESATRGALVTQKKKGGEERELDATQQKIENCQGEGNGWHMLLQLRKTVLGGKKEYRKLGENRVALKKKGGNQI